MRGSSNVPPIAFKQDGVFTAAQAHEAGYSSFRIRRLVADGRWSVVFGKIYADATVGLRPASLARAGALAAGLGAVTSHATAARLVGYVVPPDPEVHLITARNSRVRIAGVRTHRIELPESDITIVEGVVCTNPIRTAVDCLLWLPEDAGRALASDALRRRLITVESVRERMHAIGQRHGLSRAWSVLGDVGGGAHSEGEVRLHRVLREAGIGGWEANVAIHDAAGLVGIVDTVFAAEWLVIEFDGKAYHSDDTAFQRDRTRQNRLIALGYTVLRFTWDDLVHRPQEVAGLVRRQLERLGQRSA